VIPGRIIVFVLGHWPLKRPVQ